MSLSTVSKKVESAKKTENAGKTNRTELSAGKAVVNESGIELIEIVADGTGGWVERTRMVALAGGA